MTVYTQIGPRTRVGVPVWLAVLLSPVWVAWMLLVLAWSLVVLGWRLFVALPVSWVVRLVRRVHSRHDR